LAQLGTAGLGAGRDLIDQTAGQGMSSAFTVSASRRNREGLRHSLSDADRAVVSLDHDGSLLVPGGFWRAHNP